MKVEIRKRRWMNPSMSKNVVIKCDQCGVLFSKPRHAARSADKAHLKHQFCSLACCGAFRSSSSTIDRGVS